MLSWLRKLFSTDANLRDKYCSLSLQATLAAQKHGTKAAQRKQFGSPYTPKD